MIILPLFSLYYSLGLFQYALYIRILKNTPHTEIVVGGRLVACFPHPIANRLQIAGGREPWPVPSTVPALITRFCDANIPTSPLFQAVSVTPTQLPTTQPPRPRPRPRPRLTYSIQRQRYLQRFIQNYCIHCATTSTTERLRCGCLRHSILPTKQPPPSR